MTNPDILFAQPIVSRIASSGILLHLGQSPRLHRFDTGKASASRVAGCAALP
jgi:hypothetical protein